MIFTLGTTSGIRTTKDSNSLEATERISASLRGKMCMNDHLGNTSGDLLLKVQLLFLVWLAWWRGDSGMRGVVGPEVLGERKIAWLQYHLFIFSQLPPFPTYFWVLTAPFVLIQKKKRCAASSLCAWRGLAYIGMACLLDAWSCTCHCTYSFLGWMFCIDINSQWGRRA